MNTLPTDPLETLRASAWSARQLRSPGRPVAPRRLLVVPWVTAALVTVIAAVLTSGNGRALAIGAAVALVAGAVLCDRVVSRDRRALERAARTAAEQLEARAQVRVEATIRQFEWSLDEITRLRRQLKFEQARVQTAEERASTLDQSLGQALAEVGRAQQAVFELGAVDVRELKVARDAALAGRTAAEDRAVRAETALSRRTTQLAAARQRVTDLTTLLASLVNQSRKRLEVERAPAAEDDAVDGGDPVTWTMDRDRSGLVLVLRSALPLQAARLRDPSGATLLVRRLDGQSVAEDASYEVPIADASIADSLEGQPELFAVEVLVDDRWRTAQPSASTASHVDKRLRVWSRAPLIRIAG